jgi:hypothetical protein
MGTKHDNQECGNEAGKFYYRHHCLIFLLRIMVSGYFIGSVRTRTERHFNFSVSSKASSPTFFSGMMHCIFHYISVFLVISAIALLAVGLGVKFKSGYTLLVDFIAIQYATFAVTQLVIGFKSQIPKSAFKLFQWIFFSLIAILAWLGLLFGM